MNPDSTGATDKPSDKFLQKGLYCLIMPYILLYFY